MYRILEKCSYFKNFVFIRKLKTVIIRLELIETRKKLPLNQYLLWTAP